MTKTNCTLTYSHMPIGTHTFDHSADYPQQLSKFRLEDSVRIGNKAFEAIRSAEANIESSGQRQNTV